MTIRAPLLAALLLAAACQAPSPPPEWPEPATPAGTYERDSAYVAYAVRHRVRRPHSGVDATQPYVEALLYSPDSLKLFAAVVERVAFRPVEERPEGWVSYQGFGVAGYREAADEPWKLYTHPGYGVSTESYEGAGYRLREYFLRDIRRHRLGVLGPDGGHALALMGYAVDEPGYWEGPVWQRGIRLPGRYLFEAVESGNPREGPFEPLDPYEVDFPPEIVGRFEGGGDA